MWNVPKMVTTSAGPLPIAMRTMVVCVWRERQDMTWLARAGTTSSLSSKQQNKVRVREHGKQAWIATNSSPPTQRQFHPLQLQQTQGIKSLNTLNVKCDDDKRLLHHSNTARTRPASMNQSAFPDDGCKKYYMQRERRVFVYTPEDMTQNSKRRMICFLLWEWWVQNRV